jgi:hypothetical protein
MVGAEGPEIYGACMPRTDVGLMIGARFSRACMQKDLGSYGGEDSSSSSSIDEHCAETSAAGAGEFSVGMVEAGALKRPGLVVGPSLV